MSEDARLFFVEYAIKFGVRAACEEFHVPLSTGYDLMRLWDATQGAESIKRIKPGPVKGRHSKMTKDLQSFIDKRIMEDNTLTGKKLSNEVFEKFNISLSRSTINNYLKKQNLSYKMATYEDISRNTPNIIVERYNFAKLMIEQGERPEDPSSIIYFDVSYFESCIVARRARSRRGTPAIVPRGHRGIYFNKAIRKEKKNEKIGIEIRSTDEQQVEPKSTVEFVDEDPASQGGYRANSLALWAAISGQSVMLARTQFRHVTSIDSALYFQELLDKLDKEYPGKSFTFIGDNEGIYNEMAELLLKPEYHRYKLIPNPRYSPFLNAIEYLFNQIKQHVARQQMKTVNDLLINVQKAFESVTPENLLNYHKTVNVYLLKCLQKEEIHSSRIQLGNEKSIVSESTQGIKWKWDVKHRSIYATEKLLLNKPIAKDRNYNQPKKKKYTMIKDGRRIEICPEKEENTDVETSM